jgi:exosortase A-associated hydrolase 2
MTLHGNGSSAEPFFLKATAGDRFCLFHPPAPSRKARGSFIYVHPFCDEMNMTRRIAALQARAFAALGYGVLQIDLFGCGDSSGDFGNARWQIWKDDLRLARQWLEERSPSPVGLWGLRLGATLAMDFANEAERPFAQVLMWHPILNGETYLTQFMRLKVASEMLNGGEKPVNTKTMREALAAGRAVEIAGYELAPEMAAAIDSLRLSELSGKGAPVHWFDLAPYGGTSPAPAIVKTVATWKERKERLHLHLVPGTAFWSSPEIVIAQSLLDATTGLFAEGSD